MSDTLDVVHPSTEPPAEPPSWPTGTGAAARPPLVGLTGRRWAVRDLAGRFPVAMHDAEVDLHLADYPASVAAAGGLPVGLSRDVAPSRVLARLDALVLSGGADIDPRAYGQAPSPDLGPVEPERDAWELELLAGAIERHLPVLAICRGMQLLNVARGGTLVQHVAPDVGVGHPRFDRPRDEPAHSVALLHGSLAARVLGPGVTVNSLHHQIVDRVGRGLAVTGRAPDGVIEALELPEHPVLAVQWHPEMLAPPSPVMAWLVAEASARAGAQH